ncbi:ATP-dependent DNA helicase [Trichonephila clavipes]|nr:ATP-dependent DNA helicase [Trichonephila clavipes]
MAVVDVTSSDGNARNEVYRYEMGRYISSNEAVWMILNFPIHEHYPTVTHLSVHLENGQSLLHRSNYKETCQVRGLLENDEHWNATLEEAAFVNSPRILRDLFAVMLQFRVNGSIYNDGLEAGFLSIFRWRDQMEILSQGKWSVSPTDLQRQLRVTFNLKRCKKMFKNCRKEDLRIVALELGETVAEKVTIVELTEIIKENKYFKEDVEFVKELIQYTIEDRKRVEEDRKKEAENRLREKEL